MKGKVPQIERIEVNLDELRSARSYDVMLDVLVGSWEKLDEYQKDPYHCGVVKAFMHENAESSVAMDYEVIG